jgi:hypothetical protein
MSKTKLNSLVEKITAELFANGMLISEAMERARNIAQIALLDGELSAHDVYSIISPSPIIVGITDHVQRSEVSELLAAIWTAEAGC